MDVQQLLSSTELNMQAMFPVSLRGGGEGEVKQNMDEMKERQKGRRNEEGGKKGKKGRNKESKKEIKENCIVMQSLELDQPQKVPFTIS